MNPSSTARAGNKGQPESEVYTFPVKDASTKSRGKILLDFSIKPNTSNELPERYLELKKSLIHSPAAVEDSWKRLITEFEKDLAVIKEKGCNVVPQIEFQTLVQNGGQFPASIKDEVKKRGCVVIRNVVSQSEALEYKRSIQEYIAKHPGQIGGYPENDPQIWELYWSKAQIEARSHPNVNMAALAMNQLWHAKESTVLDLTKNLSYCDILRIRKPKDETFVLAEHVDGGSLERWEDPEYRKCYSNVLNGNWESHDAFDATHRVNAIMDLYKFIGGCSIFRSFQGWMSLSHVKPGGGTLRVCPLIKLTTAYIILRPLLPDLIKETNMAGASPGVEHNILPSLHPHIVDAMVSIPEVAPGDCVFWHCDCVHATDSFCGSSTDSSVLYIPSTPLCTKSIEYIVRQREAFVNGTSPPDFPPNKCEQNLEDRAKPSDLTDLGALNMGFARFEENEETMSASQLCAAREANKILFN